MLDVFNDFCIVSNNTVHSPFNSNTIMNTLLKQYIETNSGSKLSDEEMGFAEKIFEQRTIRKKQFLLHEGAVCKYLCFIVKGALRQYYIDIKGTEHIINFGTEGSWITDKESFSMLTISKYNIDAIEDTEVLLITQENFALLRDYSVNFIKMLVKMEEQNCITLQNRLNASISYNAEEKFKYLAAYFPGYLQRFPQTMLASFMGVTPETLSRIRKQYNYKSMHHIRKSHTSAILLHTNY